MCMIESNKCLEQFSFDNKFIKRLNERRIACNRNHWMPVQIQLFLVFQRDLILFLEENKFIGISLQIIMTKLFD